MKKMVPHDLMRVQITKISVYFLYPLYFPYFNYCKLLAIARLVSVSALRGIRQAVRQPQHSYLLNGMLLVDSFLVVSGFLLTRLLLLELDRRRSVNFGLLYIFRYIRSVSYSTDCQCQ